MSAVLNAFQHPRRAPSDCQHPSHLERFAAERIGVSARLERHIDRARVGIDDRDDPRSCMAALEGVSHVCGVERAVRAALQGWVR